MAVDSRQKTVMTGEAFEKAKTAYIAGEFRQATFWMLVHLAHSAGILEKDLQTVAEGDLICRPKEKPAKKKAFMKLFLAEFSREITFYFDREYPTFASLLDIMEEHPVTQEGRIKSLLSFAPAAVVVRIIFSEQMATEVKKIKQNTSFDELGVNSLDHTEILLALEEEFEIEIDDEVGSQWKTVQDVIDTVERLLAKKEETPA